MIRYTPNIILGKTLDEWDDIYHVTPNNDLYDHIDVVGDVECPCMPDYQEENNCLIVVHNSFDGREESEGGDTAENYKRIKDLRNLFEGKK